MKKQFQSKAVPRGTRTIWRYLSALILFFSLSIGQMWADSETVPKTTDNWTGTSCSLTHAECANGSSNAKKDGDASDVTYIKFRTNKNGNTMTFEVNEGYKVTGFSIRGFANDNSKAVELTSVKYDSADPIAVGESFPNKSAGTTYTYSNTTNEATSAIVLSFGTNAGTQIMAVITITYEETGGGSDPVPVSSVAVTAPVDGNTYYVGDQVTLAATVLPENATDKTLNWAMDVSDKATIADGKITFTEAGDFHLTATAADGSGKFNKVHLYVSNPTPITSIALDYNEQHINVGDVITITPTILPANATNKTLAWSVTDGATITQAGVLTAVAPSDVIVTAAAQDGSDVEGTTHIFIDALPACATLTPATSGSAIAAGDAIDLQESAPNASMKALTANLSYTENGLLFGSSSSTKAEVTLNNLMQVGTIITATIYNADASKARGLKLLNSAGTSKATWTKQATGDHVEIYTVVAGDGLAGSNVFQLQRSENACLKDISIANCGAALLDLNSAVDPVGEATVTLSATKVAAGGSATATYSIANPTAYDFDEWVISSGDATIADAHAATAAITMGTTASVITLKLKAASTKHTVTYYDENDNNLGEELVVEGQHPVGLSIAPRKLGYTFAGWGTSKAGPVVAFNEVTVNADMPLYTIWNEIDCSTLSGTIFSLVLDKAPAANCTIKNATGFDQEADLIKYGTVSGGIALAKNSSSNNHIVITTDPKLRLLGGSGKVHIQFDCALKEGDKIRTTIENQNISYTTTDVRSTTNNFVKGTAKEVTITSGHALENATEIYLWSASSSDGRLISLEVIRPEKYAVTFNMHGHGDAVDPQSVTEGGKVTKPADPTASGWDFGGWFTDDTYGTYWDFENMTISAATEIHALWTVHTTSSDATLSSLTVNGVAITLEDGVFGYAFELPMGTTALPTIVAVANDPNSKGVSVLQTNIGSATITVTAEDDSFKVYTISFTVATSKDIELVWDKSKQRCDATTPAAVVKSDDATVSAYINKMTFTGGGEGSSLNVGNTAGNMVTLTAKPGYAISAMSFFGKIEADDAKLEYSLNGGAWTDLASTNAGDACYADVFTAAEVHELRMRSAGNKGFWIRNMQLTMIEACTPIVVAWDEEPVEFEVGKAGYAIAATANNSGTITYGSTDASIVAVDAGNGVLSVAALGSVSLSASTPEGDGSTYCANGGDPIVISKVVNTYHLVTLDALNGETPDEIKFYSGDAAIAEPAEPVYAGHTFDGWLDESDDPVVWPLTPTVSMALHASWTVDCTAPTIDVQPASANYLTGRAAVALNCEATAAGSGALSYVWYSCDDELRTNPIELAGAPTPSTAAAGTFYFFCAVTEEGCANVANSNVAVITVTDKDAICLVKAELAAGSSAASITATSGAYKDDANIAINVAKDLKLGGTGKYVKVAVDGTNFQDGDIVVITLRSDKDASAWLQIFADEGTTLVAEMTSGVTREHPNYLTISGVPANTKTLYLYRTEAAGGNMNPYPTSMAVYRACAPILNSVTVAGVEGAPDNTNHVAIEVPASTADAALEAIVYNWVSNSDAWTDTHDPAVANAWEWGVENTLTFADKDGDESVYYVTISKAVPSSDATLSALSYGTPATAIALADGVYTYDVELPYGTSDVPALAATKNHVGATIVSISDAAAFVNRHATSTVTVTAEDGTTTQVYTVNFVVSRYESKLLWDGSTMTALSEITAAATAAGVSVTTTGISVTSFSAKTCEENGKSYPRALDFGGKTQSTRYFGIEIPAGKVAKVSLVYRAKSTGRSIMVATALSSAIDESTITSKDAVDGSNLYVMKADMFGGGTLYINTTDGFHVHEISIQLADGYARSAMLGNGVLGTVCVDHNVAVEDIQGVTVYELVGREPQYGKVAFDEIISGELEAGAPYVFQAHGNHMALLYGETSVAEPVDKGNGMYGTFVDQTLTELNDIYYFAQRALWSCVDLSSLSVPANRAYVKLSEIDYISDPNPAPGRRRVMMSVNGKNTPTALDEIRQEQSANSQKLLINGQLFILRGEKMYDATGRLVK